MIGMGGANQIASLFVKIGADARQFENAMGGVDRRLGSVGGAVTKFGALVGAVAVGSVVALGVGLTSVLRASAEFEKTISGAGAVLNATAEEMEQLSDAALRIGKDTAFSASEAAGAIEMLAKNGLGVAEIMNGAADATVALAAATGANLATAADVATDAMAQFNIRAEDMSTAIDGITGVVVASKFDINDYALALSQGGGVAAAVGVSFEDFNATIAAISSAFGSGSDAGTSFKTFLQRLVPQSKPAAEMMMRLGLLAEDGTNAFFDAAGGMKSMADIAGILQKAFGGLSDSARIEAFTEIFGTDAMRAAGKLSEVGSGGIADMLEAMSKVNATEQAAKRLDNLAGDVEQLSGSFDTLKISIGQAFTPLARKGVQWLTKQINKLLDFDFGKWAGIAERGIESIGKASKTVGGIISRLYAGFQKIRGMNLSGPLQGLFSALVDTWLSMQRWMLGTALPAILTTMGQWGVALVGWIAPQVPGILAELGNMFVELGRWFVDALPGIVAQLTTWGAALVGWIAPQVPALMGKLGEWTGAFLEWAGSLWVGIRDNLSELWGALTEWVTNPAKRTELASSLKEKWTGFTDWASGIWEENIAPKLGTAYDALQDWIKDPTKRAETFQALKDKWTAFADWAGGLWTKGIAPGLMTAFNAIKNWITDPAKRTETFQALKDRWTAFTEWAGGVWETIQPELNELISNLNTWINNNNPNLASWRNTFASFVDGMRDKFNEEMPNIERRWQEFGDKIGIELERIANAFGVTFGPTGAATQFGRFFTSVLLAIGDVFLTLVESMLIKLRVLAEAFVAIGQIGQAVVDKNWSAVQEGLNQLGEAIAGFADIWQAWGDLIDRIGNQFSGTSTSTGNTGIQNRMSSDRGGDISTSGMRVRSAAGGWTINVNVNPDTIPTDRNKLQELARLIWREAELSGMRL